MASYDGPSVSIYIFQELLAEIDALKNDLKNEKLNHIEDLMQIQPDGPLWRQIANCREGIRQYQTENHKLKARIENFKRMLKCSGNIIRLLAQDDEEAAAKQWVKDQRLNELPRLGILKNSLTMIQ